MDAISEEDLSITSIRTAMNTKTIGRADPWGSDQNPIMRRLTEGSVA